MLDRPTDEQLEEWARAAQDSRERETTEPCLTDSDLDFIRVAREAILALIADGKRLRERETRLNAALLKAPHVVESGDGVLIEWLLDPDARIGVAIEKEEPSWFAVVGPKDEPENTQSNSGELPIRVGGTIRTED